jgi:hypothetical protein
MPVLYFHFGNGSVINVFPLFIGKLGKILVTIMRGHQELSMSTHNVTTSKNMWVHETAIRQHYVSKFPRKGYKIRLLFVDYFETGYDQRFVSSTGNMEVLLSHIHSILECPKSCQMAAHNLKIYISIFFSWFYVKSI